MENPDYLDLIPPPNSMAVNFMAWLLATVEPMVNVQETLGEFVIAFGIQTAVGDQLDIIGQILNLSRTLDFNPGGGQSPVMDDETYRTALIAKVMKNQWKGTKKEIYDFWQKWLPQYPILIQDNQDMSMSVLVIGVPETLSDGTVLFGFGESSSTIDGFGIGYWEGVENVLRGIIEHGYFIPKPAGVSIDYAFFTGKAFGFGVNNNFIGGFGDSTWINFS